ncbi:MAG: LuxR C-terminal-related transcriptional regulator [Candidatus Cyclobacteriaceae bacterium M2_1C_046]
MSLTSTISVLLVDFQYLTRKALALVIENTPGFKLVAQIERHHDLLQQTKSVNADLVVLDAFDYKSGYLEEIIRINHLGESHVLIVTNNYNNEIIQTLLKGGIKGIITKNCSESEIVNAIQAVSIGRRYYCNAILDYIIEADHTTEEELEPTVLSPRELEVLKLIATGNTTQKIADKLHISIHTVNSHRKNILRKLKINSPIHLIAYAVKAGLVSISDSKKLS